jgi:hypothetical protein
VTPVEVLHAHAEWYLAVRVIVDPYGNPERLNAAVAELERRAAIEARRDAYGHEFCVRYLRGGVVEVEYELGKGQGRDLHEATEAALNDAGAP